jgi:hypothetical protein
MNPIKNPFSPGAGSPPYDLFGRENILKQARILLGRTQQRRSEKSMLRGLIVRARSRRSGGLKHPRLAR